jgi:toxin ParE1/3/4
MAQVIISTFAEIDLDNIWDFISEKNVGAAEQLIKEFGQKFNLLAENPNIGRRHDEIIIKLRSFPHKKYIIFYFESENGVEIYRVLHGARNIEDLFEDYFEGLKP